MNTYLVVHDDPYLGARYRALVRAAGRNEAREKLKDRVEEIEGKQTMVHFGRAVAWDDLHDLGELP